MSRDREVAALVQRLDHEATHRAVRTERAVLRRLGGSCQVPIAALATVEGDELHLRGLVAGLDGERVLRAEARGPARDPDALGTRVAEELLAAGAADILRALGGSGV